MQARLELLGLIVSHQTAPNNRCLLASSAWARIVLVHQYLLIWCWPASAISASQIT